MDTVPTNLDPLEADPAHAHPSWCFSASCTAPDRLAERGEADRDVPIHRRGLHFSWPHIIPTTRISEVAMTLELHRDVYTEVTDMPDGVLLTYHAEICGHGGTLLLTGEQMAPLVTAFSSLRDAFEADRNPLMDRVAEALRVLGCITQGNAAALLDLTALALTDRERGQVLRQFTPGDDL